ISGYCATGRICDAMTPASAMMIAMTLAKIGRLMKKREKLPIDVPGQCFSAADGEAVADDACFDPSAAVPVDADACFDASSPRGCTAAPGCSFIRLSTITSSPGFKPSVTIQSLPSQFAVCTVRCTALPSALAIQTLLARSVWVTAGCGIRYASRAPASMRTLTNCPGSHSRLLLGNAG